MISLAVNEARMIGRRGAWPAALVLHALATALFVILWAPTGGVPLWQSSVLQQLAAFDRVLTAAVLTWLSTFVLADDEPGGRDLIEWSAVCGRPARTILRARIAAISGLTLVFLTTAAPAFVAAADVSAAPWSELAADAGAALGFACLAVGVTSAIRVTVKDRVAVWCIAMTVCLVAVLGVRMLNTMALRAIAPAIIGGTLLAWAPYAVRGWRLPNAD
jgi:hypothetical protein